MTLTGQIERNLDIIWTAYPNLKGNAIETIVFILTMKASEILTGQKSIHTLPVNDAPENEIDPPEIQDEDSEWSD
jgi:hypothetical protein